MLREGDDYDDELDEERDDENEEEEAEEEVEEVEGKAKRGGMTKGEYERLKFGATFTSDSQKVLYIAAKRFMGEGFPETEEILKIIESKLPRPNYYSPALFVVACLYILKNGYKLNKETLRALTMERLDSYYDDGQKDNAAIDLVRYVKMIESLRIIQK